MARARSDCRRRATTVLRTRTGAKRSRRRDGRRQARARAQESLAKSAAPMRRAESLGTGHGAREFAHVDQTDFERATRTPAETLAIRYDSYANLVAQGIIERPIARRDPQPFPGAFVPDPPMR
jgi:hypothetical protein